jgi:thiol-disulfide isomerase/thioredoxin
MVCPKCGQPRSPGPECERCGVVYAKFRPAPSPSPVPSPPRRGNWWPAAILAALAAAGVGAWVKLRAPAPRDGSPAIFSDTREMPPPRTAASEDAGTASALPEPEGAPPAPAEPPPGAPEAPAVVEVTAEPASCEAFELSDLPDQPSLPSVSSDWYDGASGLRRAGEEQASSGAPLLLYFYVDWCPHCRRFTGEVLPSPEMRELGQHIVKVKVDAEGSEDDRALARQFSVRSFPTLLVITSPGRPPARVDRWSSPAAFVESCRRLLPNPARDHLDRGVSLSQRASPEQAAAELKAAAGDPTLAARALDHLGLLALRASCFSRAQAIFDRIRSIDSGYRTGRIYHLRGYARWRSGDRQGALEDVEQACRLGFKEGCTAAERLTAPAAWPEPVARRARP